MRLAMTLRAALAAALLAAPAAALLAAPAAAQTVAIEGARVVTNTGEIQDDATVVIRDGRLASIGGDIPDDARMIEGEGLWVTPGIIAPITRLGLAEIGLDPYSNDISADGSPFSAALSAADAYNPMSSTVAVSRIEGVTHVGVAPESGSTIFAGRGATVALTGGFDSILDDAAFLYVELGEDGAWLGGGSRMGVWTYLRAAIRDARQVGGVLPWGDRSQAMTEPDALAFRAAVRGELPLVARAHRASDIVKLIALKDEIGALELILFGGAEAWMVADELAEAEIPVILDPMMNLPSSFEALGSRLDNAALLEEAGVTVSFAIHGDDAFQARLILQQAGNAVANGMSWDAAFAGVTSVPAEMLGLDGAGELRSGGPADLVVWDGDPLEAMTRAVAVFIDGEEMPMVSRQTRLRDRYSGVGDGDDQPYGYR